MFKLYTELQKKLIFEIKNELIYSVKISCATPFIIIFLKRNITKRLLQY